MANSKIVKPATSKKSSWWEERQKILATIAKPKLARKAKPKRVAAKKPVKKISKIKKAKVSKPKRVVAKKPVKKVSKIKKATKTNKAKKR